MEQKAIRDSLEEVPGFLVAGGKNPPVNAGDEETQVQL